MPYLDHHIFLMNDEKGANWIFKASSYDMELIYIHVEKEILHWIIIRQKIVSIDSQ
jgi:hypothetical protein